jgi:hypothetical protein
VPTAVNYFWKYLLILIPMSRRLQKSVVVRTQDNEKNKKDGGKVWTNFLTIIVEKYFTIAYKDKIMKIVLVNLSWENTPSFHEL